MQIIDIAACAGNVHQRKRERTGPTPPAVPHPLPPRDRPSRTTPNRAAKRAPAPDIRRARDTDQDAGPGMQAGQNQASAPNNWTTRGPSPLLTSMATSTTTAATDWTGRPAQQQCARSMRAAGRDAHSAHGLSCLGATSRRRRAAAHPRDTSWRCARPAWG